MRFSTSVIFASCAIFAIHALPTKPKDSVEEVEVGPMGGRQPVIDTDFLEGPFGNPFGGVFDSFAGIMNSMRQQMDFLLRHLPQGGNNTSADGLPIFPSFPDFDLGKGNTTSVTKIIDGHKVVINETDYKHETPFGGSVVKVRVIDVLPDSSELTTEKNAEEVTTSKVNMSSDPEAVEESFENEISKNRESEIESFDEIDAAGKKSSMRQFEKMAQPLIGQQYQPQELLMSNQRNTDDVQRWDNIEPLDSFEENVLDNNWQDERVIDLSDDILINKMMADAGAPTNPDAEVFSSSKIVHSPRSIK